jgi:hypothetical protein
MRLRLPTPTEFLLPGWDSTNFCHIAATVDRLLGVSTDQPAVTDHLPAPADVVVSLFVDSLGWTSLERRMAHPVLARFLRDGILIPLTTQFPSSTGGCVPTHKTGLPSPLHGVPSLRYFEPLVGDTCDPLRFCRRGDAANSLLASGITPAAVFPFEPRAARYAAAGVTTVSVVPERIADSAFNCWADAAVAEKVTFQSFEEITPAVAAAIRRPGRRYVDVYMDDVDKCGHAHGPDSPGFDRLVERVLTLIGEVADACAEHGARLVMFADHGQVPTPPGDFLHVDRVCPKLAGMMRPNDRGKPLSPGGGTKALFLFVQDAEEAAEHLRAGLHDRAFVAPTADLIAAGWFGDRRHPAFHARLGDVAVIPLGRTHLWVSTAPKDRNLGAHGGLQRAEMLIPFGVL